KGRAIFLTGGGTGLGRSMALRFSELGARLFLVGRREDPLRETCQEILRLGGAAAYVTCDVRDYAAVEAAAERAEQQFGEINVLVNNAAGNFIAPTEKLSANAFNAVVGIVLNGSFHCTQAFAKRWISRKLGGNVLNIVTTYAAANCGSGFVVPSACAKAGVLALTTSLAVEWAMYHIRINAIAPGHFPTQGAWSRLMPSKQFEEHRREKHPRVRRVGFVARPRFQEPIHPEGRAVCGPIVDSGSCRKSSPLRAVFGVGAEIVRPSPSDGLRMTPSATGGGRACAAPRAVSPGRWFDHSLPRGR